MVSFWSYRLLLFIFCLLCDGSLPSWVTLFVLPAGIAYSIVKEQKAFSCAFIYTVGKILQNLVRVSKIISKNFQEHLSFCWNSSFLSFLLYSAPPDDRACGVDVPSGILAKVPVECFGLLGLVSKLKKYGM